jgi:hypothetical protein
MSGVPQHDEHHDAPQNPCHEQHGSPPDHADQPSGSGGISLDLTGLLNGQTVDISLPISLEASSCDSGIGSLVDIGGDGNGLSLLSFDSDTEALVNLNLAAHDAGAEATIDVGSLLNAAVLDIGGTSGMDSFAHCDAYDGNVPLAGDLSSALGATLDHLTTSSSLFDVPALDVLCFDGLDT